MCDFKSSIKPDKLNFYCHIPSTPGSFTTPQYRFLVGLEKAFWPGRTQCIEKDHFTFYLDGAHTRKSIEVAT